ncbi:uncharacterized protein [Hyperolius riggenbachi]|uniref:uncharacterized protein n=1 Tax=Hyperolius riggenbachi TaxID=752182 RepID=UPI0035A279AA
MDIDTWGNIFEEELENRGIFDAWSFSVDENFQGQKGWLQYSLSGYAKLISMSMALSLESLVSCGWKAVALVHGLQVFERDCKSVTNVPNPEGAYYVRFVCSDCDRSWGSSKVHITFYLRLHRGIGQVKMHIFGQKCKMCLTAIYERPTFTDENIEIVISHLVNRICQKYYGLPTSSSPRDFVKDTREEGPHQSNNCEACAKGICKYSIDNNPKTQTTTKYQYTYTYEPPSVSQPRQSSYWAEPFGRDLDDVSERSCSTHCFKCIILLSQNASAGEFPELLMNFLHFASRCHLCPQSLKLLEVSSATSRGLTHKNCDCRFNEGSSVITWTLSSDFLGHYLSCLKRPLCASSSKSVPDPES